MKTFRSPALCLLALGACRANGPGSSSFVLRAHAPRVAPFDVLHYELALALEPASRSLTAEARIELAALPGSAPTEVELDLVGLAVDAVTDEHGRALAFERTHDTLAIELAEPLGAASALT
ncbi:MAG: hypothetical protein ABL998_15770, partial [Planctomycetota bacterium]